MIIFLFADFTYKYCVQFYQHMIQQYIFLQKHRLEDFILFHFTCLSKHCISLYIQFRIITCHIRNITKCVCQKAVLAVLICMCVNTCICMVDRWPNMLLSLTPQRSFAFLGVSFQRDIQIATEMHFHVTFRRSYAIFNTFIISLL